MLWKINKEGWNQILNSLFMKLQKYDISQSRLIATLINYKNR